MLKKLVVNVLRRRSNEAALRAVTQQLHETQQAFRAFQVRAGVLNKNSEIPIERNEELASILLMSPPKSAGAYITEVLKSGLGLEQRWLAEGHFIGEDHLSMNGLERFWLDRGCIGFLHSDANAFNVHLLAQTDIRIILNIRDPRQCINSLVFYVLRFLPHRHRLQHMGQPPNAFASWSLDQQIDWQIDTHLDNYVRWIEDWVAVIDNHTLPGLITRYDDLVADEHAFFNRIITFCDLNPSNYSVPRPPRDDHVNFRRGDAEEWKSTFTDAQRDRCASRIPDTLKMRFGWPSR